MNKKDSLTKDILRGLAIGGAVAIALTNPFGARHLFKAFRKERKQKKHTDEQIKKKLYYLRKKELLHFEERDGKIYITLTENGKKQALAYDIEALTLPRPGRWDKRWRLVMFDIPEKKRGAREALTSKIRELGFVLFNRSVWIYPYDCEKEIDFIAEVFEVSSYVHYITATSVSNEDRLKLVFKLA